jgi:hypothetical protein
VSDLSAFNRKKISYTQQPTRVPRFDSSHCSARRAGLHGSTVRRSRGLTVGPARAFDRLDRAGGATVSPSGLARGWLWQAWGGDARCARTSIEGDTARRLVEEWEEPTGLETAPTARLHQRGARRPKSAVCMVPGSTGRPGSFWLIHLYRFSHMQFFCFFFFRKIRLIVRVGIFPDFPYFPENQLLKTPPVCAKLARTPCAYCCSMKQ